MDCTYKSNKYRLHLLNVVGTICLNGTFYVAFDFLLWEKKEDFTWFLTILHSLYQQLDLEDPKVIVTDRDIALMAAIYEIFPRTTNLLCLWHIKKNGYKVNGSLYFKIQRGQKRNRQLFIRNRELFSMQNPKRNIRQLGYIFLIDISLLFHGK